MADADIRKNPSEIIEGWWGGKPADAHAAVAELSTLRHRRSAMLELAYGEYCVKEAQGEILDHHRYCERFSQIRSSLGRRLEVHDVLSANSSLLPSEEVHWPSADETILGFKLLEQIGSGGFSRVFLAEELALSRRPVVVKVTRSQVAEAQILAKLQHENIVPIYSTGRDEEGALSICVMPFLSRHTLSDFLDAAFADRKRPRKLSATMKSLSAGYDERDRARLGLDRLPDPEDAFYLDAVIELIRQLAEALTHTHARGVLHLDIKPSNVLLTPTGRPMLMDFNLSADQESIQVIAGGTLPYMSPEQIRTIMLGQGEDKTDVERLEPSVDTRSDIYSLGVVFYELLVGRHPFNVDSWRRDVSTVARELLTLQADVATQLRRHSPRLDAALVKTVQDCLAHEPDDRIQSAVELANRCQRLLRPVRRTYRHVRTDRATFALFSAAMLALFVLAIAFPLLLSAYKDRRAKPFLEYAKQFVSRGQFDEAYKQFEKANAFDRQGETYACMGYCATRAGDNELAIAAYHDAIRHGCATAEVHAALGYSYKQFSGGSRKATNHFAEAVRLDPSLQSAYIHLAVCYLSFNSNASSQVSIRAAQEYIDKAKAIAPLPPLGHLRAARIALAADMPREEKREIVLRHWVEALRGHVKPINVFRPLGRSFLEDDLQARRMLNKIPNDPPWDDFSREIPAIQQLQPYLPPSRVLRGRS